MALERPQTSPVEYIRLFRRNRSMRLLWSAGMISRLADWFHYIAIHTLVLRFFSDIADETVMFATVGFWTTVAFLAQMIPPFLAAPWIGNICDRYSRRQVMRAADLLRAILALSFLFISTRELLIVMIVLEVLLSILSGFFDTAQKALVPDLVERNDLVLANGIIQSTWSLATAMGAGLGAVALTWLDVPTAFILNAATFLISFTIISMIQSHEPHVEQPEAEEELSSGFSFDDPSGLAGESALQHPRGGKPSFMDALRYSFKRPSLLALLLIKPGWSLPGGTILILHTILGGKVYDTAIGFGLQGETIGIGLLHAARGVGALVGMIIAPIVFGLMVRRLFASTGFVFVVYGILYAGMSQVDHILTASLMLAVACMCSAQLWVAPAVVLQQVLPANIRGRIFALDSGFNLVALGISGFTAHQLLRLGYTPRSVALVAGIALIGFGFLYAYLSYRIRFDIQKLEESCRDMVKTEGVDAAA
jgi:MFS family permease